MQRVPDFDDLIGPEGSPAERERLLRIHELLIQAGPPPELSPELEAGPTLALTLDGRRRPHRVRRRAMLLVSAAAAIAAIFLGGFITGNHSAGSPSGSKVLSLAGTRVAPAALASLTVEPADAAGNWPMVLTVTGLPKLPARGYYEVFLVRNGRPFAPCGTFLVAGASGATRVMLNAPYRLKHGDSWLVTRQDAGDREPGSVVLRPVSA